MKTKPYRLGWIAEQTPYFRPGEFVDDSVVGVRIRPEGQALAFAYFDGRNTWDGDFRLGRPEDLDNDGETNCWKVIGGMSYEEKRAEFDPLHEGGAQLGSEGTGPIDIEVEYRREDGTVTQMLIPTRVVLHDLIIEVDWMEGSAKRRVLKRGPMQDLPFRPRLGPNLAEALGQCGLRAVVKDSLSSGNRHASIPLDASADRRTRLNRLDLADLVERRLRDEIDPKSFNEGLTQIANRLFDEGYIDFDPSRPDTVYVICAQRWRRRADRLNQTLGATCLLERDGKRIAVCFVFMTSIAESIYAVNRKQDEQIDFNTAVLHTLFHEIAAHRFPAQWNNGPRRLAEDAYWSGWRHLYAGHHRGNPQHDAFRKYETCVSVTDSGLDAAYYAFMSAPRLHDFRWRLCNSVEEKCRDIVRDAVVDGSAPRYGRLPQR